MEHITPKYIEKSFHCPNCGIYSSQTWAFTLLGTYKFTKPNGHIEDNRYHLEGFASTKCDHCQGFSLWKGEKMIIPMTGTAELPNADLPEEILKLYNEARDIVNRSPRGAAALLRLALQKLCEHLGEKGQNINDDIKSLVSKGLPIPIQQALDIIRVTGNHAVHPGTIDFEDQAENALALFGLTNFICNHFITNPKQIAKFYSMLPVKDQQNIAKRDGQSPT